MSYGETTTIQILTIIMVGLKAVKVRLHTITQINTQISTLRHLKMIDRIRIAMGDIQVIMDAMTRSTSNEG